MKAKKIVYCITAVLMAVTIAAGVSGCEPPLKDAAMYLTQKMNEIPIEFFGYKLVTTADSLDSIDMYQGETTFQDKSINIERGGFGYIIHFDGKEYKIDDAYMREKSEVYKKIHRIWYERGTLNQEGTSKIFSVCVYDNKLFIVTNGIGNNIIARPDLSYPVTLYYFDIETETVLYADYYENAEELYSRNYNFKIESC